MDVTAPNVRREFLEGPQHGTWTSRHQIFARGELTRPAIRTQSPQVRTTFLRLEKTWKRETQYSSSPTDKYLHPSYARIIGLGAPVLPFILNSMKKQRADWFYALRAITGEDPVSPSMAGNLPKMTQAWLDWGAARGLI